MNTRSTGASKKRKAEANGLDEMDRELYQKFRAAANSVSALYTSSMSLQKRAFNAGSRRTTEKLLEWALTQQENGEGTVNAGDLVSALQAELVVLEGEDACLAAAGDSPGAIGVWEPRASAGRRAGVDAHAAYESELGAKLGQAFTQASPTSPASAGGRAAEHHPHHRGGGQGGQGGGGHHAHHPSPGNRMMD